MEVKKGAIATGRVRPTCVSQRQQMLICLLGKDVILPLVAFAAGIARSCFTLEWGSAKKVALLLVCGAAFSASQRTELRSGCMWDSMVPR